MDELVSVSVDFHNLYVFKCWFSFTNIDVSVIKEICQNAFSIVVNTLCFSLKQVPN